MEVAHMPDSTMLQSKDLQERYERYKAKIKNFTIMDAPITGSPSSPITLPVTFEVCAETTPTLIARNSSTEVNFFFIDTFFLFKLN